MSMTGWTEAVEASLLTYALGLLEGDELDQARAWLAEEGPRGDRARRFLWEAQESLDALVLGQEAEAPPASLRARVLAAASQTDRLEDFVAQVSAMLRVGAARARELLSWVDEAWRWEPGPSPESSLIHLPCEAALGVANVGFVRVQAGADFPAHQHEGQETVLVLQGGLRDSDGSVHRSGALIEASDGSSHSFQALEGPDLLYLVILERGVQFDFPFTL